MLHPPSHPAVIPSQPSPDGNGKVIRRLHGYSSTASLVRCIGGLLSGAAVTTLLLFTLDSQYQPLRLPPSSPTFQTIGNGDDIILYERIEDATRKGAATVVSDTSDSHLPQHTTPVSL